MFPCPKVEEGAVVEDDPNVTVDEEPKTNGADEVCVVVPPTSTFDGAEV